MVLSPYRRIRRYHWTLQDFSHILGWPAHKGGGSFHAKVFQFNWTLEYREGWIWRRAGQKHRLDITIAIYLIAYDWYWKSPEYSNSFYLSSYFQVRILACIWHSWMLCCLCCEERSFSFCFLSNPQLFVKPDDISQALPWMGGGNFVSQSALNGQMRGTWYSFRVWLTFAPKSSQLQGSRLTTDPPFLEWGLRWRPKSERSHARKLLHFPFRNQGLKMSYLLVTCTFNEFVTLKELGRNRVAFLVLLRK